MKSANLGKEEEARHSLRPDRAIPVAHRVASLNRSHLTQLPPQEFAPSRNFIGRPSGPSRAGPMRDWSRAVLSSLPYLST